MLRVLLFLAELGLLVYCLLDCVRSEPARVRNLPKAVWVLLVVLLPVFGSVGWLLAGRPTSAGPGGPDDGGRGDGRRTPRGPDDDPDFLRGL